MLKEIKTISEVSKDTGIGVKTLYKRIEKLIEDRELIEYEDYKKLGKNQPIVLSKEGIGKIVGGVKNDNI